MTEPRGFADSLPSLILHPPRGRGQARNQAPTTLQSVDTLLFVGTPMSLQNAAVPRHKRGLSHVPGRFRALS